MSNKVLVDVLSHQRVPVNFGQILQEMGISLREIFHESRRDVDMLGGGYLIGVVSGSSEL